MTKFREPEIEVQKLNVRKVLEINSTPMSASAAELNVLDGVTGGTVTASKALVVDASRDIATIGAISADGRLDVDASIAAGASVGHLIKQENAAAGSYSGSNFGLTIKNYDADGTVVHNGGENGALGIWAKFLSEPIAGGENVIASFHQHSSSTANPKHGLVIYGDPTNGLAISGGTSTYAISVVNQTLTNLFEMAAGAEARVASTYCDVSANSQKSDAAIRVTIGGTAYFIPAYTAGNTDNSW